MIKKLLFKVVAPVSLNEDNARSEFILNVLLCASAGLSLIVFCINVLRRLMHLHDSVPLGMIFFVFCFFLFLYSMSRKGFCRTASYFLLTIFFSLVTYQIYTWGSDLPSALLSYVLIIVMAGVLISTRVAFIATLLVSGTLGVISYMQLGRVLAFDAYWKKEPASVADFIVFVLIFLIIAIVSWLSNREIERSLVRARRSEAALKKERDSLEVLVEEKTKELKDAQAEKMAQLYRFAEFGRLSSGLFHDLVNPLSAISLNMQKAHTENSDGLIEVKASIEQAMKATKKMESLVAAVRKQLSREENDTLFSVADEIRQVIEILSHKTMTTQVTIEFSAKAEVEFFGDATKFHHAVLNLLCNAIDAYTTHNGSPKPKSLRVLVSLGVENNHVLLSVQDWGAGIRAENIGKIFEPFFTTKFGNQGIGIGLSMTKRIVEKNFNGTISVESKEGKGSIFNVKIPIKTS